MSDQNSGKITSNRSESDRSNVDQKRLVEERLVEERLVEERLVEERLVEDDPNFRLSSRPERSEAERSASSAISATEQTLENPSNPLTQLRQFTPARIALGRTGASLPTNRLLEFSLAHALARDAVQTELDIPDLTAQLNVAGLECFTVKSAAPDRQTYLRRPDLGRKLDEASRKQLARLNLAKKPELVFIIADGLSAIAPQRYAVPVIQAVCELLPDWQLGPVILAEQARVAVGDEVGELLQAEIAVMLLGERPGLSSPDSLGIYLTYQPKVGRTDAERNCISNVREEGTSPMRAAGTLTYLLTHAKRLRLSGVQLKDTSAPSQTVLLTEAVSSAQKQIKST